MRADRALTPEMETSEASSPGKGDCLKLEGENEQSKTSEFSAKCSMLW